MADKIVSWGGFDSKSTSGMGITGSLGILNTNTSSSVLLDIVGSTNNSLTFISNPILSGGQQNGLKVNVSTAGYDANGSNIAYNFQVGGTSYFTIANYGLATFAQSISTKGILIQGNPSNTTSLIVYAQGAAGNAIETGGSEGTVHLGSNTVNTKVNEILRITGKGTTSSTTSFLVQNANASGSLSVKDDGSVGIGTASPFSSGLTVANPAYTGYGRVYMNANNTFIVADNGTGGNITFGPSNRIFINSQQVSLPSGYISIGNSATISTSGSYQGTTFSLGNFIAANIGGSTGLTIASRYTQQGAGGPNTGTVVRIIDTGIDTIAGVTNTLTMLAINPSVNTTGGTTTLRGIYYNPTISSSVGLVQHTAIETTAGSVVFNGGNVGIGISNPATSLHISGASAVLTLTPQTPLPSGVPTGSFAVSSSVPPKPYFYDGTAWNALY